jgi:chaperonin GroES
MCAGPFTQEGNPLATASASSTKLRPLGDRVVIEPTPREEMTKSGIVLPDTAKEKPQEGKIRSVGPGRFLDDGTREKMDVKKGDRVLYAKYAGTEFKVDDLELLILSQKDILAIVEG